ncbi:MAG: methyltransferase domain-containing protein [Phycisphaerales bacterium]|nr:methyltransferase domain-containing protein [Phycisphaerales bacterium]MCB9856512.1 methyltransferase domain-containing protein [Phycisphaerales bacterium]MCB9863993.1 methyltransferase domain-containing protein [Phycisphaerales bacterium]
MSTHSAQQNKKELAAVVQQHFDGASADWMNRYTGEPSSMADLDLILRRMNVHQLIRPLLAAADRRLQVIDVGCGSGDVLDGLPRDVIRVTGMDFSREMTRQASVSHRNDTFARGDATKLPFGFDTADIVTSLGVLEYVPNPIEAVSGIAEILRPGGHLIVSFPNRSSLFRKMLRAERAAEKSLVRLRDIIQRTDKAKAYASQYRHRQWTPAEAVTLLNRAGLIVEAMLVNTYGPWGRLGRFRIMRKLSAGLSRRWTNPGFASKRLACTMVIRARKPDHEQ